MKVEIEKEEKQFEPFKLTLTVESEDELKALYHIFNVTESTIKKNIKNYGSTDHVDDNFKFYTYETWYAIKAKCIELGIYKQD